MMKRSWSPGEKAVYMTTFLVTLTVGIAVLTRFLRPVLDWIAGLF